MKFLQAIELGVKLASVKRTVGYRKAHLENDAEHSYQLALTAWSANHQYKLGLNDELILKFAIVHDLVEIYAGDVDAHGSKKKIANKKEIEKKALEKMKQEYFQIQEILQAIEAYEKKDTQESMLVYVVDKLIPDVNVFKSKSNYFHKRKVTVNAWKEWLYNKINYDSLDQKIKQVVDDGVKITVNDYQEIFYKTD